MGYELQIPESHQAFKEAMRHRALHVAILCTVKRSTCSKCGEDYRNCGHSELMDAGLFEEIVETGSSVPFWTDRHVA